MVLTDLKHGHITMLDDTIIDSVCMQVYSIMFFVFKVFQELVYKVNNVRHVCVTIVSLLQIKVNCIYWLESA